MNKIIKFTLVLFILYLFLSCIVFSHPGRTDSNGGHYNRTTGEYHYHDGEYAGQKNNYSSTQTQEPIKSETKERSITPLAHFLLLIPSVLIGIVFRYSFRLLFLKGKEENLFECFILPLIIVVISWVCLVLFVPPEDAVAYVGYFFIVLFVLGGAVGLIFSLIISKFFKSLEEHIVLIVFVFIAILTYFFMLFDIRL